MRNSDAKSLKEWIDGNKIIDLKNKRSDFIKEINKNYKK